jgi:hypothetical protein
MQKKIISLGKQLVESLATERDDDVDMLSRWMSHYIAEQIVAAENATDATKVEAEERCFRTILSLWEHRSTLPNGRRPFESFEPLFESLARLHPDEPRPFYLSSQLVGQMEDETDEVKSFVQAALSADIAARSAIDVLLAEATRSATSPSVQAWLENALSPSLVSDVRTSDISIIIKLKERAEEMTEPGRPEDGEIRKNIERRIERLDGFVALCQFVRTELAKQLDDPAKPTQR